MVDTKVSAFPALTSITGNELVPLVIPGSPPTVAQTTASLLVGNAPVLQLGVGDWVVDPAAGTSNFGQSEQELDLVARFLPGGTYDQVAVNVTSAGATGSVFRVAIYTSDGGKPSVLLGQSAAIDSTTTGVKQITLAAPFVVPTGGAIVWAGTVCQGGASSRPNFTRVVGSVLNNRLSAVPTASDLTATYSANYYTTGVSAAPPSTWTDTRRFDSAPRMAFRRSA